MPEIKLIDLKVLFQENKNREIVHAIDDVTTSFPDGKISVILGASGSGKTTLLNAILGNVGINGDITFNDVSIRELKDGQKNYSYVSQDFALYPHMTVFENIAFPLNVLGSTREETIRRVNEVADFLGLGLLLSRLPKQLSIGQKQKVSFARALVKRSDIYLFDEPFSNLDKEKVSEIRVELKKILKSYNSTVIFVTHDSSDAFSLADRIYVMENGKFIFEGSPDEALKCADPNVTSYFKD